MSESIFPTLAVSAAEIENQLHGRKKRNSDTVQQKTRSTEANTETEVNEYPWRQLQAAQKAAKIRKNSEQGKDQIENLPEGTFAEGSTAANALAIAAIPVTVDSTKSKTKAAGHPGEAGSKLIKQESITEKEKTNEDTITRAKQIECAETLFQDRQAKHEIDKGDKILCKNSFEALAVSNMEVEEEEAPKACARNKSTWQNSVSHSLDERLAKKQRATSAGVVDCLEKEMKEASENLDDFEQFDIFLKSATMAADVPIMESNESNTALVDQPIGNAIPANPAVEADIAPRMRADRTLHYESNESRSNSESDSSKFRIEEVPPAAPASSKDGQVIAKTELNCIIASDAQIGRTSTTVSSTAIPEAASLPSADAAPSVKAERDSTEKRHPKRDEPILVLSDDSVAPVIDGKVTFVMCNRKFKLREYWIGTKDGKRTGTGEIHGIASVTEARLIGNLSELLSVLPSQQQKGLTELPYKNTYLVSLKNARRVDSVAFEHRRGHTGIVKYAVTNQTGNDFQDAEAVDTGGGSSSKSNAPDCDELHPNKTGAFLDTKSVNPVVSNIGVPRRKRLRVKQALTKTSDVPIASSMELAGMEAEPAQNIVLPTMKLYDEKAFSKERKAHIDGLGCTGEDDQKEQPSVNEQRNATAMARKAELHTLTVQYNEIRNKFLDAETAEVAFARTREALRKDTSIPSATKTLLQLRCCVDQFLRADALLNCQTYTTLFLPIEWDKKDVADALKPEPSLLTTAKLRVLMVEARKLGPPETMERLHQSRSPAIRENQLQADVKRLRDAAAKLNLTHRVLLGQSAQQTNIIQKRQILDEVATLQGLEAKYNIAHDKECMMALRKLTGGPMTEAVLQCFKPLHQSFLAKTKNDMDNASFVGCRFSCQAPRCKSGTNCQVLQGELESSGSRILNQLNLGGFPKRNRHSNLNHYSRLFLPDWWQAPELIENLKRKSPIKTRKCPLQIHPSAQANGLFCRNAKGCEGGLRCLRAAGYETWNRFRLLLLKEKNINSKSLAKLMATRVKAAANAKKKRKEQPRASFFMQKKWKKTIALERSSKLLLQIQDVFKAHHASTAKILASLTSRVSKLIERSHTGLAFVSPETLSCETCIVSYYADHGCIRLTYCIEIYETHGRLNKIK